MQYFMDEYMPANIHFKKVKIDFLNSFL